MDTQTEVFTKDTSAQALHSIGWRKLSAQQQKVFDVVRAAQLKGAKDMSLVEIRDAYNAVNAGYIETGRISARVSELVTAQRLARREETRRCSVTAKNIHPVYVPERQVGLFPQ